MWMMPMHLHVKQKSDYDYSDDDDEITKQDSDQCYALESKVLYT